MRPCWIAVLLPALLAGQAAAHPHFFIDVRGELDIQEDVLVGLTLLWRLDDMSATMVLSDCDESWNDKIDPEEEDAFREHYLEDLGEENFSATWLLEGQEVEDPDFGRFRFAGFRERGEPMVIELKCDLNLPIGTQQQKLSLRMAHPMYLVAFTFVEGWQSPHTGTKIRVSQEQVDIYLPAKAPPGESESGYAEVEVTDSPDNAMGMRDRFFQIQARINRRMNEALLGARKQYTWLVVATLFPLAAAYGLVHAAGPGHGKSLVIGYFLHRQARLRSAFLLALVITGLHSLGALLIAGVFQTFLADVRGIARIRLQGWLTFSVGMGIVAYGGWLIFRSLQRRKMQPENPAQQAAGKGMLGIGILAGLIPCPFTVAVLLLAITHGLVLPGLAVVGGIVTGTFVLLCVVGLITIKARGIAGRAGKPGRQAVMHRTMGLAGGLLVLIAGFLLALLYYPAYTR